MANAKRRSGAFKSTRKDADDKHILLARGLSARYLGANVALSGLTSEEIERDLRHFEAYSNACTVYAQQYFIHQNQTELAESDASMYPPPQPVVAMPVRIDPDEDRRLTTLRQQIHQYEAQREFLEGQYLSLRAHYVYVSQVLKKQRGNFHEHVEFLQSLVQKRGDLVAMLRVRLQMTRDVLAALHYRQELAAKGAASGEAATEGANDSNLLDTWNEIEENFKRIERECMDTDGQVVSWHALSLPKSPPGVPLFLSQLSKDPGYCAGFGCNGIFGSNKHSMFWLDDDLLDRTSEQEQLPDLRSEVALLDEELERERKASSDLQTEIIARKVRNDELVATMMMLRSETEAVVARHNVILDSDQAKEAAAAVHQKEQEEMIRLHKEQQAAAPPDVVPVVTTEPTEPIANGMAEPVPDPSPLKVLDDNDENDGDDEGQNEEEDDEEDGMLDEVTGTNGNAAKRSLDVEAQPEENGSSPKNKRRKL